MLDVPTTTKSYHCWFRADHQANTQAFVPLRDQPGGSMGVTGGADRP